MEKNAKTIVILGPTASGKTGVAVSIAKALENWSVLGESYVSPATSSYRENNSRARDGGILGAEIISADSRAIYKGMDLGTAKPSLEEQQGIPHWGLDLVEPGERFTVADWKKYAEEKIEEICERGRVPIVAGGTGLYIDALVYDYDFTQEAKNTQKNRLEVCTNYLLIGVKTDTEVLRQRINQRIDKMFVKEMYEETRKLVQQYGWGTQAMKSNIYQFVWGYLQGEYSLERAKELARYDDWHLAKRQLTWFKRNKNIIWLPLAEIEEYVIKCIQDEQRK